MVVAEKFGQLPTTVERELDEYWLNRIEAWMEGESINTARRERERKGR